MVSTLMYRIWTIYFIIYYYSTQDPFFDGFPDFLFLCWISSLVIQGIPSFCIRFTRSILPWTPLPFWQLIYILDVTLFLVILCLVTYLLKVPLLLILMYSFNSSKYLSGLTGICNCLSGLRKNLVINGLFVSPYNISEAARDCSSTFSFGIYPAFLLETSNNFMEKIFVVHFSTELEKYIILANVSCTNWNFLKINIRLLMWLVTTSRRI